MFRPKLKGLLQASVLAFLPASVLPISAATLCVAAGGANGCLPTISGAVSAAAPGDTIQVGPGTYKEAVVITKSLYLLADRAILDGSGLNTHGIFVNGMAAPGLRNVTVSGFTVQNSAFEGILVANASSVTVSSNTVINNNKALSAGTCPGLPAFETNEQSDCGEGIHFLGVDHSIISNNTSIGNAGGILLADDTGATHDNLVSLNNVRENPYACGITLASHPAVPHDGGNVPFGVYHNTVYGNRSSRNGLLNGGGSGVGIFASVPGAASYGNVIVNNYASENGLPGIAMHAHAPGQNLNDNVLVGNTIVSNAADDSDAATPGPTGINIYGLMPVTGTIVSGNSIQNETVDIAVKTPSAVDIHLNNLFGLATGVVNLGAGSVNASSNWWSCDRGPGNPSCSSTAGSNVVPAAWLSTATPPTPTF